MSRWMLRWYLSVLVVLASVACAGAQFVGPPQNVVSDSDANQPFALHVKTFGADTVATTFAPGSSVTADQGAPAVQANRWPMFLSDGAAERLGQQLMAASLPVAIASNQTAVPISASTLPLPTGAAQEHTTAASPHAVRLSDGTVFYDARAITSTVVPSGLASLVTGQQAVTAAATALPANAGRIVCLRVIDTGTQTVSFGPSGVTTATGQQLVPGEGACRPLDNANRIFVIAPGAGSTVGFEVYN